ncbi:PilW family protein [soil metagenome]
MNGLARQHGMSLVELMVALTIGTILIIGAVSVYMQSRSSYRVNEAVARLQENGRFALDTIEPDIRLARYWGQTSRTDFIEGRAGSADPNAFPGDDECGPNWGVDLDNDIEGSNNGYALLCAAYNGNPAGADVLVVRHASANPAPLQSGRIQIQTDRAHGEVFSDGKLPDGFGAGSETFNLIAHAYYISADSTGAPGLPSLRRKALGTGPDVSDEEIITGVEDLQVQFGVDTTGDGIVNRYVNPGAVPGNSPILAVRLWLRLRAEAIEVGFQDDNVYAYANQLAGPLNDRFRRLLVSKTILLRNTR